jgi:hypothetical protein
MNKGWGKKVERKHTKKDVLKMKDVGRHYT